ncbi:MAG: hypothetical protein CBE00_01775 [Planctomycetaceae bacterium TMED240]|nr:hypothetical protein [Rhodopirellula sp.]OUX08465.1 MAG: hypothetical protein CBE00_01775 [Planctomycetaceae bacterium TMED240]
MKVIVSLPQPIAENRPGKAISRGQVQLNRSRAVPNHTGRQSATDDRTHAVTLKNQQKRLICVCDFR